MTTTRHRSTTRPSGVSERVVLLGALVVTLAVAILAAPPNAQPSASFTTPRVCGFVKGPKVGSSNDWLVVATKTVECAFAKKWMARLAGLPIGAERGASEDPGWASCIKATGYSISCADAEDAPGDYMSGTACGHAKTKRLCTVARRGGRIFR